MSDHHPADVEPQQLRVSDVDRNSVSECVQWTGQLGRPSPRVLLSRNPADVLLEEAPEGLCPVVFLELYLDGDIAPVTHLSASCCALTVVGCVGPQHVPFMSRYTSQGERPDLGSRRVADCQMHVRTDGFAGEPFRIRGSAAEKGRGDVQHHLTRASSECQGPPSMRHRSLGERPSASVEVDAWSCQGQRLKAR